MLKWPNGGLGAFTDIIPKERCEWYQKFHNQKSEKEEGGMDEFMNTLTINMMLLQQCLPTIVRDKRDPYLSTCLCPLARMA